MRTEPKIDMPVVVIQRAALILPQWAERQFSAGAAGTRARYRRFDHHGTVRLLRAGKNVDGV